MTIISNLIGYEQNNLSLYYNLLFNFGYKPLSKPEQPHPRCSQAYWLIAFKKLLKLFQRKSSIQIPVSKPPRLRQVQIVEHSSLEDMKIYDINCMEFVRSYWIVRVKDKFKNEIKNVYEAQLRYMNGGVYLLEEEGI